MEKTKMNHLLSLIITSLLFSQTVNAQSHVDKYNGAMCTPLTIERDGLNIYPHKYHSWGSKLSIQRGIFYCQIATGTDRRTVDLGTVMIHAQVTEGSMRAKLCYSDLYLSTRDNCGPVTTIEPYSNVVQFVYSPNPKPSGAQDVYIQLDYWSTTDGEAIVHSYLPIFNRR